jgi:Predicted membrane protein (DUF2232)
MERLGAPGVGAVLGAVAGLLYLSVMTGSPGAVILAYLAQLPLFAAGLWLGVIAAVSAGAMASVLVLAAAGWIAAAGFAALNAAPILLLVRQAMLARRAPDGALEWYPAGLLAAWLSGIGLAGLAAGVAFFGGPVAIEGEFSRLLAPAIEPYAQAGGTSGEAVAAILALVMPGTVAASWMIMTASNAVLAQGLLARFGRAWRPSPDIAAFTLPSWLSVLLVAAAILLTLGGAMRFVGVNVLIVLLVPFSLAGLAVLHGCARRLRRPQVALVAFYSVALLFGWPLLAIAVVGALDAPLGLRRRFAAPRSIGGN